MVRAGLGGDAVAAAAWRPGAAATLAIVLACCSARAPAAKDCQ